MSKSKLKPLKEWICDVCGEIIDDPEKALVLWDDKKGPTKFNIIHKDKCDKGLDHKAWSNMNRFLGKTGGFKLVQLLCDNMECMLNHSAHVGEMSSFVDVYGRLQVPYYEEARQLFNDPLVQEFYWDCGVLDSNFCKLVIDPKRKFRDSHPKFKKKIGNMVDMVRAIRKEMEEHFGKIVVYPTLTGFQFKTDRSPYWFDFSTCCKPEDVVHWVHHLISKNWLSAKHIHQFISLTQRMIGYEAHPVHDPSECSDPEDVIGWIQHALEEYDITYTRVPATNPRVATGSELEESIRKEEEANPGYCAFRRGLAVAIKSANINLAAH